MKGAQYLAYRAGTVDGTVASYTSFQNSVANRTPIIYVGANDGMLHAFNANTGVEVFAFIPTAVIENLNKLTSKTYGTSTGGHQYYVDGSMTVADVYFGNDWHTVLVGSLGGGGREVFALDITNPNAPKLLWEFTSDTASTKENGVSSMGYSFPAPPSRACTMAPGLPWWRTATAAPRARQCSTPSTLPTELCSRRFRPAAQSRTDSPAYALLTSTPMA